MITSKEKAFIGGLVAFVIGLANVVVPFISNSSVLHYITIGLAVVSFIGVYFGVYATTNTTAIAKVDPVSPPIILPSGAAISATSDPVSTATTTIPVIPPTA
jgi:hypothetical protein